MLEIYADLADNTCKAYNYIEVKDGKITSDRQRRYVRPLYMGLLSETDAKQAPKDLNNLVVKNDYHLNTGFLTTPYLCKVLADYGYIETAYRLLLQEDTPGWLFEGVCGIHVEGQKITIKPQPNPLLQYAKAAFVSPAGTVRSEWRYVDDLVEYTLDIPANAKATFVGPDGTEKELHVGENKFTI